MLSHEEKLENLNQQFKLLRKNKNISLKSKKVTHFFRQRHKPNPLDLHAFDQVITVNIQDQYVQAEGLATFYSILNETLRFGFMPAVVPEMRNITVGGAISGLGVEASSFKYGLVHENVTEMEVLTGNGDIITCSPTQNADLFKTMPNSLGTIGYVLQCKMKIVPVGKFVEVELFRFSNLQHYFMEMKKKVNERSQNFIEGVIFSSKEAVLIVGRFVAKIDEGQKLYNVYEQPWYRYIQHKERKIAYFTVKDFFWRWDVDVYWGTNCPGIIGWVLNNQVLRKTILKNLLRSDRLLKLNHLLNYSSHVNKLVNFVRGREEALVQDLGIDIDACSEFLSWYQGAIAIYPLWVCPVRVSHQKNYYPLYLNQSNYVVDIGFYAAKKLTKEMPDHFYNKLIEQKLQTIHGMKGLYSTSYYSPKDFWAMYDKDEYFKVKKTYDPDNVFPDLYEKAVGELTK